MKDFIKILVREALLRESHDDIHNMCDVKYEVKSECVKAEECDDIPCPSNRKKRRRRKH